MNPPIPRTALQLRSLIRRSGELEISLAEVDVPEPAADEVLVRIEATPINPSDLGLLFGAADISNVQVSGSAERPVLTAPVPEHAVKAMAGRVDKSMPVGNEGAGVVVKAGGAAAAQALLGKTVAMMGGAMYTQYRCIKDEQCLRLPNDATSAEGTSCFVNPLTAQGMVETMRSEGHVAWVHTAAASNLGQMLNRICIQDGIALVSIVRKREQVELLKAQGARFVCKSESPDFMAELTEALAATGATITFDAIGGGKLAGQIMTCMEAALARNAKQYSRYGTSIHTQVYLYGMLDPAPTTIARNFGFSWGMGGWLLFLFLDEIGPAAAKQLHERVAAELKTKFASSYSHEVSLAGVLQMEAIAVYGKRATGAKYLITPNQGIAVQRSTSGLWHCGPRE